MTKFNECLRENYNNFENVFCTLHNVCLSPAVLYFKSLQQKEAPTCPKLWQAKMASGRPIDVLQAVSHIFWTILPILFWISMARLITQICKPTAHKDSILRFTLEFVIIMIPTVLSVNIANAYVEYFVCLMSVILGVTIWKSRCFKKAQVREFELGTRPCMLTLARSTINILTVLCILAIDFANFPKDFRKTRQYGAGLMDVGIGLFVFSMGSVSRRPRNGKDFKRLVRIVAPMLVLGLARTVVIVAIDYHQDEHEYGRHLNAFFTLGFTKLFGAVISAMAVKEWMLLPLGVGILACHELILQAGVAEYVMDNYVKRDNFFAANREGFCSLPGFIGVYIISMYIGQWLQTHSILKYYQFMRKLKNMAIVTSITWTLVLASIFTVQIARVTCNFGYAAWILAIAVTMTLLYMFVFDLVLNTLWPLEQNSGLSSASQVECETAYLLKAQPANSSKANSLSKKFPIPSLVEAVNLNGLTYFLVANILTGGVNIFLKPEDRSDLESISILTIYMLLSAGLVYLMYRLKLRIA